MKQEYVVGFAIDFPKIALIEKLKPEHLKNRYNGIGGKIESGETPIAAMVREFEEEAGLITTEDQWEHRITLTGVTFVIYFFLAELDLSKIKSMEEEQISIFDVNDMPSNILPNMAWLVPLALDQDIIGPVQIFDKT